MGLLFAGFRGKKQKKVYPDARLITQVDVESVQCNSLVSRIAESGGIEPALRAKLWPPLLGLAPWPEPPMSGPPYDAARAQALDAEYASLMQRIDSVDNV